jgi:LacI family transcriptional regulator
MGVLRAVSELGLSCPDDIAIASFDGVAAAMYSTPGLTTVQQPFRRLAQAAVQRLLARLEESAAEDEPHASEVLQAQLVRRGSCGCADPTGDETED